MEAFRVRLPLGEPPVRQRIKQPTQRCPAGLDDLADDAQVLRLMKSVPATYSEVDKTAEILMSVMNFISWSTDTHTYMTAAYYACQMKRRHWLVAREEIDEEQFCAWLPAPECGSAAQAELKDNSVFSNG